MAMYTSSTRNRWKKRRRNQLAARALLLLIAGMIGFLALVANDPDARVAILIIEASFLIALLCNRAGHVTTAVLIVVAALLLLAIWDPIGQRGGLSLDEISDFEYLSVTLLVIAGLLRPALTFAMWALTSVIMCLLFFFLPHNPSLTQAIVSYSTQYSAIGTLLGGPAVYNFIVAGIAYWFVRGVQEASETAYRAISYADVEAFHSELLRTRVGQEREQHQLDEEFLQEVVTTLLAANEQNRPVHISVPLREPRNHAERRVQDRKRAIQVRAAELFSQIHASVERDKWQRDQLDANLRNFTYFLSAALSRRDFQFVFGELVEASTEPLLNALSQLVSALLVEAAANPKLVISHRSVAPDAVEQLRQQVLRTYDHVARRGWNSQNSDDGPTPDSVTPLEHGDGEEACTGRPQSHPTCSGHELSRRRGPGITVHTLHSAR